MKIEKSKHDAQMLKDLQELPLEQKIIVTQSRILEWHEAFQGKVYISFSGGKDSTVLLDIARKICPDIPAVFVDTGLEYPEIRAFALQQENVQRVFPRYGHAGKRNGKHHTERFMFQDVLSIYGYPLISKEVSHSICGARNGYNAGRFNFAIMKMTGNGVNADGPFDQTKWLPVMELPIMISDNCCLAMKKRPSKKFAKESGRLPITGQTATESKLRRLQWLKNGCNGFDMKSPVSNPMAFWREGDILEYIVRFDLPISSVYGEVKKDEKSGKYACTGCKRTGCIFCAYGLQCEKGQTRFQRLAWTHPKQYEYCIGGGQWVDNPKFIPWLTGKNIWNPRKIWVPSKQGLGMGKAFDMCNEAIGKKLLRYR